MKMIKTYEDMVAFSKDNMEAMVKSSNSWSKGMEQLSKECFSYLGRTMDTASSNAKKYSSCKSAVEAMQLGNEQAKTTIESFVSQSKKIADLSNSIAQEAAAPINARSKNVADTMNSAMNTSMSDFTSQWQNCCGTAKKTS
jgi:phasin family protein